VLLDLNGSSLEVDEPDVVTTMRELASGDLSEQGLADWVRAHQAGR
jgi:prophage maintenance system killer protein